MNTKLCPSQSRFSLFKNNVKGTNLSIEGLSLEYWPHFTSFFNRIINYKETHNLRYSAQGENNPQNVIQKKVQNINQSLYSKQKFAPTVCTICGAYTKSQSGFILSMNDNYNYSNHEANDKRSSDAKIHFQQKWLWVVSGNELIVIVCLPPPVKLKFFYVT